MNQKEIEVSNSIISKYSPNNDPNDFFCLTVSDNAAEPKFCPGDLLIIKMSNTLEYDGQLLIVHHNEEYLLRRVFYDDTADIYILKDYCGIYPPVIVTDEDDFFICGYPVQLLRDLNPVYKKEGSLNDE